MVLDASVGVQGHHLIAGAIACVSLALLTGIAYVFQPAVAAFRRPRRENNEPYTFPKEPSRTRSGTSLTEEPFPTLEKPPEVALSLVIPSYNEEERLPIMLDATLAYLKGWKARKSSLTYELVVVDDGSKDKTAQVVLDYSKKLGSDTIRLLKLRRNQGKGGALREGMLHIRGQYGLMVDADGATDITCLEKIFDRTKEVEIDTSEGRMAVGIGSRAHMEKDSVAKRAWYRTILMKGLHVLVCILISGKIKDTQCGFKLFTRSAVKVLFGSLHLERWGFDLEIIHLCDRLGLPMVEVPVNWHEVEGSKLIQSKLDVIFASLDIFRDMLCVRLCYLLGLWTTPFSRLSEADRRKAGERPKSE